MPPCLLWCGRFSGSGSIACRRVLAGRRLCLGFFRPLCRGRTRFLCVGCSFRRLFLLAGFCSGRIGFFWLFRHAVLWFRRVFFACLLEAARRLVWCVRLRLQDRSCLGWGRKVFSGIEGFDAGSICILWRCRQSSRRGKGSCWRRA